MEGRRFFTLIFIIAFLAALSLFVGIDLIFVGRFSKIRILGYVSISLFIALTAMVIFFFRSSKLIITTDFPENSVNGRVNLRVNGYSRNLNWRDQICLYFFQPGDYDIVALFNENNKEQIIRNRVRTYPGEAISIILNRKENRGAG